LKPSPAVAGTERTISVRNGQMQERRFIPLAVLAVAASLLDLAASGGCANPGTSSTAPDADSPVGFDAGAGHPNFDAAEAAAATLAIAPAQLDFSLTNCGAAATSTVALQNPATFPVTVSATATGGSFAVSPEVVAVPAGGSTTLSVMATVPGSAMAGSPIVGSLTLTSDAPGWEPINVPLSVTPRGAVLAYASGQETTFSFPFTEVGYTAGLSLQLANVGNAPAAFLVGAPTDPHFSLVEDAGVSIEVGGTWTMSVDFTATSEAPVYATSQISASGATCAPSLESISYSAAGTVGNVTGWPSAVDFGAADCGGAAPPQRSFALTNAGPVVAHIVEASLTGAPGFKTTARVGLPISTSGVTMIYVDAPPVPVTSPLSPITATLSIETDSDPSPHTITLTEEPSGAILVFDTSATAGFGSFGQVPQLGSSSQGFRVVNTGSAPAQVTLVASPQSFSVSVPEFALNAAGVEDETATFAPQTGGSIAGSLSMIATGVTCAPVPAAIPLSGASGAVPVVTPTSLSFAATCGGSGPASQTITITNGGNGDMTWSLGAVSGVGAAQYAASASPAPGTLSPGASASVTVTAAPIASPAPSLEASAYAAEIVISTDVPLDPAHVITLGETPLGDQLVFQTPSPLRFGQVPTNTTLSQLFVVTNNAAAGSPAAQLVFSVQGAGAGAYSVAPTPGATVAAGGGASTGESIVFAPIAAIAYPAVLGIATSDPLCAPLPGPLSLSGTGL
jgi:hypothetical protein